MWLDEIFKGAGQGWDSFFFFMVPILISLSYFKMRRKVFSSIYGNCIAVAIMFVGATCIYSLLFYSMAILRIRFGSAIDVEEAKLWANLFIGFLFVPAVATAIDRQLLLRISQLKLTVPNPKQILGNKEEINRAVKAHTLSAKQSVYLFSGQMSWIKQDQEYFSGMSGVSVKNLCNQPKNKGDEFLIETGEKCGILTKYYGSSDPFIRARLIDSDVPSRARAVVVSKEHDAAGVTFYRAQIFDSSNGAVVITSLSKLFESLWSAGNESPSQNKEKEVDS